MKEAYIDTSWVRISLFYLCLSSSRKHYTLKEITESMNLLKYICLPGLLASGDIQTVSAVESKTDKNPNILVILIDDAGYNDFGFMGSKEMQTPILML